MKITKYYLISCLLFLLVGCEPKIENDLSQKEADYLFKSAMSEIKHKKYSEAIKDLENIQLNYPQYADYDLLLYYLAHSQFNHKQYLEAQDNAHEYLNSYSHTKHSEEMSFVEAMSQYRLNGSWIFERFLSSRALRDTSMLEKSYANFKLFLKKHPNSQYKQEAQKTMDDIAHILAESELEVARYNLNHKAYLGAIQRAQGILETYPNLSEAKDAMVIMDTSFEKLALNSEHAEMAKKLKKLKEKV